MKNPISLFVLLLFLSSCQSKKENVTFEKPILSVDNLKKHSAEFITPEVIEVVEGVHVAIGFGLANSILIEGENGNIIVDCMESNEAAAKVKAEFDKISNKPIKALIYTWSNNDSMAELSNETMIEISIRPEPELEHEREPGSFGQSWQCVAFAVRAKSEQAEFLSSASPSQSALLRT